VKCDFRLDAKKMTHLRSAAQVYYLTLLKLFQKKIHFFRFFDSLRHGIGELTTQYPNFKL